MTCEPLEPILRLLKKGPQELLAHSLAVARLVERMLALLPRDGLPRDGLPARDLLLGALAHDVGKVTWPAELFAKHPLSNQDWALIRIHPLAGRNLLREAWPAAPEAVLEIVAQHHERPAGRGYPYAKEPCYPALVVAAADALSAMTTDRAYRPALSLRQALDQVARWAPPRARSGCRGGGPGPRGRAPVPRSERRRPHHPGPSGPPEWKAG